MTIALIVATIVAVPSGAGLVLAWLDHRVISPRGCMCRIGAYIDPAWRRIRR